MAGALNGSAACYPEAVFRTVFALSPRQRKCISAALLCGLAWLPGCRRSAPAAEPAPLSARRQQQQQARALLASEATARTSLEEIPPPLKHRYLDVHSTDAWQNPFLSVHRDSVTLRVIFPRQTGSALDAGTMLHPDAARKQELEVRLNELPEALAAVPDFAWPYGRVVAIEESPTAARQDRPQVRRNVEAAIRIINDLDVVVDEWNAPTGNGLVH